MTSNHVVLPQTTQQKQHLKDQISSYIDILSSRIEEQQKILPSSSKQVTELQEKVATLRLRLKLIDKCQDFSLHRLNHLEEIFKYYCTHIYKTGKHMTFDRLQYQKQHLTTERFFLFLKDFNLTITQIEGKPKEILQKQSIMTIFKKISSNSRDLTFQEFINCLEKLGILYYDEKASYWTKIQEARLERIKRKKQIQKRKIRRMKINGQKVDERTQNELQKLENEEKKIDSNNKLQLDQNSQSEQEEQKQQKEQNQENNNEQQEQNYQNDDLIKEMMQDKDLEDPNEAVNQIANKKKQEVQQIQKSKKKQQEYEQKLLTLTNSQKIEYFYQMIGVDSVKDCKNKLTALNTAKFKKQSTKTNENIQKQSRTIDLDQSDPNAPERSKSQQQQQRIRKLKEKMNEKKEKLKNLPIPKPKEVKESETAKKRRQMKEERQFRMVEKLKEKQKQNEALRFKSKQVKNQNTKKPSQQQNSAPYERPSFNQRQVNWQMIQKMSFDQLKLRQFQPTKFYHQEDDDHIFLHEYGDLKIPNKGRASRMQARQRQSLSIVQNMKKRADEVEKTERREQNKLEKKVTLTAKGSIKGKF